MKKNPTPVASKAAANASYLELFFPIHYIVGITIEDVLRSGMLTRQQTCILWLIRAQGEGGRSMRRKEIERSLAAWFEITSSAVSKALRGLAREPLKMITISEDPDSGREKIVHLTAHGERFLERAIDNGNALMQWMTDQLSAEEIESGIHFLTRVSEIFAKLPASGGGLVELIPGIKSAQPLAGGENSP